ncbi:Calx-beta domain protein [Aquisphaera giovannonii]|uniref:Calx-beta domain protein n=1 Tax=Aquisphaera giovannonii TaxID=406548 RepID=A0A5B9VTV7_9BACT|nr:Calx-beta domain-containing protein [Aquisphaera giovannonii]QEH31554.1 Calx-beta domain protein [Aquisphaera giovannonii]
MSQASDWFGREMTDRTEGQLKARRRSRARSAMSEVLEPRTLLSAARAVPAVVAATPSPTIERSEPLRVVLISSAVAQAGQVAGAAGPGVIALTYDAATTSTAGLVGLLEGLSASHGGAPIAQLGIVAHGTEGRVSVGGGDAWDEAGLDRDAAALESLRGLLAPGARLDLYSCSVAAGADGKALVDRLASLTGADVYASDDAVGSGSLGDFTWEYVTHAAPGTADLLPASSLERIPGLKLDDPYEPNNSQAQVNAAPAGGANSPNLGTLSGLKTISGLALEDGVDWYRFQTTGVATTADYVSLTFSHSQGDIDLYVYRSDGATLVNSDTGDNIYYAYDNASISLRGELAGTFYVKVVAHSSSHPTIPTYGLSIHAPTGPADDAYEEDDSKAQADAATPGAANSPNLGTLSGLTSIPGLVLGDAADWYRFQTTGVATTADYVSLTFDHKQGDIDLYVYRSDGATLVNSDTGDNIYYNYDNAQVSLRGELAGTFYVKVVAHGTGAYQPPGIASYGLSIHAPTGPADDAYEEDDSKAQADAATPGAANSPNLGTLSGLTSIPGLVLGDAADWYRFQTTGVATTADYVSLAFDHKQGDIDLYVYRSDGATLVNSDTGDNIYYNYDNAQVSLRGELAGTFYVKVVAHGTGAYQPPGIASYGLSIHAPTGPADDAYEEDDSKAQADAAPAGGTNSPNFGALLGAFSVPNLVLGDAADWYRFQTTGVATTADYVSLTFDHKQGDIDLYVYRSDGATLVNSDTGDNIYYNYDNAQVSLRGELAGTFYVKVVAHGTGAYQPPGIASYGLSIHAPTGPADDAYEEDDSKAQADAAPAGGTNSPNFGALLGAFSVPNLVLGDAADWYRFQTTGVATTADYVSLTFDHKQGDIDLYVYRSDGATLVNSDTGDNIYYNYDNAQVSLRGELAGTFYVKVVAHGTGAYQPPGIASYGLSIHAPTGPADDAYEEDDSKAQADAATPGAANSPNLGTLSGLTSIPGLVLGDAADWYRFQTTGVATTADYVSLAFDHKQGDIDLYVYRSDGATLVNSDTGDNIYYNYDNAQVSLRGELAGTFYVKVVAHGTGAYQPPGIASYGLSIHAPTGPADDAYEEDDSKAQADAAPAGGTNSPNFGALLGAFSVPNLVLGDAADWYRFQTTGIGGVNDAVTLAFDHKQGDIDLYVYRSDGTTLVGSDTGDNIYYNYDNASVSLKSQLPGTYYVKVIAHNTGAYTPPGIANYTLAFSPPAAIGDDAYEENDSKAQVDAATAGAANSPNLGVLTSALTIPHLVMNDAADWFRFQTQGVGTTSNAISITFDKAAGDLDLVLYRSDGTTVVRYADNDYYNGNTGTETISLAGVPSGTYYAKVYPHTAGLGIADYTLTIAAPGATGDDDYEENDGKAQVDAAAAGAANSPSLGVLTSTLTIPGLVMDDAADWFKFQTQGVGTTANSVSISFDKNAGDLDLVLYRSDGTTVVRYADNDYYNGNTGTETISLAGVPAGTYYAVAYPHTQGFGIASYSLTIAAPAATGDDAYEENDSKAQVDAAPAGGTDSPNLGVLTSTVTIPHLVMNDGADWFRFQTQGVGTTANSVGINFDKNAGDLDLVLYRSDGTTVVRSADNDYYNGNAGTETISLAGVPSGTYYARVYPHTAGFGIADYTLTIAAPGATGDDAYEENDSKVDVDSSSVGSDNSPNLGTLVSSVTIPDLVMDDAADWFRFQTAGSGTTSNSIHIDFDKNAGDLDLVLYRADGTTLVSYADNDYYNGNTGSEAISLAGVPSGTYYVKVYPHTAGFGIANYSLTIAAPGATGDDAYEENDSKVQVDAAAAGGANSPNLGVLTSKRTIPHLVMNDAADWFRFETQGVGTASDSVSVSFDKASGDLDLVLLRSDGIAVVRHADNDYYDGNTGTETISLAGVPSGVYYAVAYPHRAGFGIADYALTIAAPGATGDDAYEENDSKVQADAAPAGGTNSPNLGLLTSPLTIPGLVLNDAADWFRFQTDGNGTAADSVSITFDRNAGDLDLALYASNGTTVVRYADNDYYDGNTGTETISLDGVAAGTYYAVAYSHTPGFGIDGYSLHLDPPPPAARPGTLQLSGATYSVGESDGTATITVTRADGSDGAVSIHYATSDGTAKAGSDYTATSGTLNFANGETSKTFTIPITPDFLVEGDEALNIALSSPGGGATLGSPASAVLTIRDDDAYGSFGFSSTSYSVAEGGGSATITVYRTGGTAGAVSVHYATSDGTAKAGQDYTAASGTLSFANGETSKSFTVPITDDSLAEGDESLNLSLSSPAGGASLGGPTTAALTIVDDDVAGTVQFSAASYSVSEGGGTATITVTRSGGTASGVTVHYATSDGTAKAGSDYTASSGTLTFGAGETGKTFTVPITADTLVEGDETLNLTLSSPGGGATLGTPSTAVLTIADDDVAGTVQFSSAAYSRAEGGGTATITVTRSGGAASGVTVHYATSDGTAKAGQDYTAASGTLTFAANETTKTFAVPITDDSLVEGNETVNLTLSSASGGATLGTPSAAVLTIVDDDVAGTLQFSSSSYSLAEGGGAATITVTRSGGSAGGVTVHYATADGTATAGSDYTAASGTLAFAAGETSKTFTVAVLDDHVTEGNETVTLTLSSPTGGATLGGPSAATLTILDDDDDAYEPNNSKAQVDSASPGGLDSPNLGVLTSALTIPNLVMNDGADWFRFETKGVGAVADSVSVTFDPAAGDLDLVLYRADGTTVARAAANDYGVGNQSPETIGLAGLPSGVYYAVVTPHDPLGSNPNYTLRIVPPAATGDDAYEENDGKAQVDAASPGAADSPNLGVLTSTTTIPKLVMDDGADWFKFQTLGVGTVDDRISLAFDPAAGDVDLVLYRADGTTVVRAADNDYDDGNTGQESISLAGVPSGTYYALVTPHAPGFGIDRYDLEIDAPGATGDDAYEENDSKAQADAASPGAANSPNFGTVDTLKSVLGLVMNDGADWFRFQTAEKGTVGNAVTITFDPAAGDMDLYVYAADGTTLVSAGDNDHDRGNGGIEAASLDGLPAGTYYAVVVPHASGFGIDRYDLEIAPASALVSIAVNPSNPTAPKGTTQAFTATGTYSDGSSLDLTALVSWASSSPAVATVDGAGRATALAVGTTTITASLGGITSPGDTLTVSPAALVSIAVASPSGTFEFGSSQQLVATGTYTDGGTADLTGVVSWASSDASVITVSPEGLATAHGTGNATITAGLGGVTSPGFSLAVTPAGTTTAASDASATYSTSGQSIPLSATVGGGGGGAINAGSVTFTLVDGDGNGVGTPITVPVVDGVASGNYGLPAGTPAGSYAIRASYGGSANYSGSYDSGHGLTLGAAGTATAASGASVPFSESGQSVPLTASVTSGGGTVDAGDLTFTLLDGGGHAVGSPLTVPVQGGVASGSYALPAGTPAGAYTIRASYGGTPNFGGSSDSGRSLIVGASGTAIAASGGSVPFSLSGQAVPLSASVTSGAGVVDAGSVTFTLVDGGGKAVGTPLTVPVANGVASGNYNLPAGLPAGSYAIQASYGGTPDLGGSSDNSQALAVTPAATTTAAANASVPFSGSPQSVPLTATVSSPAGTVGAGSVTFTVLDGGGKPVGTPLTVPVQGGVAAGSYPLPAGTPAGAYTVQASYGGTPDLSPSSDSSHGLTVEAADVTVEVASVGWNQDSAPLADAADGIRLLPPGRANDLPWFNIDRIVVTLSEAVALTAADVSVRGLKADYGPVTLSGVGTTTVTVTLAKPVAAADLLTLKIGNDRVVAYRRRIDILPGDVNDDKVVNTTDGVLLLNQATPAHAFQLNDDMDGDGSVTRADFLLYRPAIGTTLPAPPPQLAAGGSGPATAAAISDGALHAALDEAIAAWASAGLPAAGLARLRGVAVRLADLPAGYLGTAAIGGTTVEISPDADGRGWSTGAAPVPGREDLVTVLAHELGHALGLADRDPAAAPGDLMAETLAPGVRRLPAPSDVAAIAASGSPDGLRPAPAGRDAAEAAAIGIATSPASPPPRPATKGAAVSFSHRPMTVGAGPAGFTARYAPPAGIIAARKAPAGLTDTTSNPGKIAE